MRAPQGPGPFGHLVCAALVALVLSRLGGALLAAGQIDLRGRVSWLPALALVAAAYVPILLYLLVFPADHSRGVVLLSMALGGVLALAALALGPAERRRLLRGLLLLLAAVLALGKLSEGGDGWHLADLGARVSPASSTPWIDRH